MWAEAQPEQEPRHGAELDEVALVVRAMLERVVVQRLGEHRRDAAPGEILREREGIGAYVRIGRAELGQAGISEARLLGEARIAVLRPVDVQEDGPRLHGEASLVRGGDELCQRVALADQPARPRLQREAAPAGRVGTEEDLTARLVAQAPRARMRKEIARGVVGRRHRHAPEPGAMLDVVEHRRDALVGEIAGEAERRRPHAVPHQSQIASATTVATSTRSSTATYSAEE